MKQIPLTQNMVAIVDDEDFARLCKLKWCFSTGGYACRNANRTHKYEKRKLLFMHRFVLSLKEGEFCDHINGDRLDNRKNNLRKATLSQNGMNKRRQSNNTSGFKGVYWHKGAKKWCCRIKIHGKTLYLGMYINIEDAAQVYDKNAIEIFGEFAKLNF
jgi:hypothetical protein